MSEVGNAAGQGGNTNRLTERLALLIRAAGDRLFRADDERARQHGWQVTVRRGGLARTYRDPRFDCFRSCPACHGSGSGPAEKSCDHCGGTGRITVYQPTLTNRERGS
jgi:hypothetical protein